MTKIALITDLHFGVRHNSPFFLTKQWTFLHDQFIPYVLDHDIKTIFILGDIFEDRKQLNVMILKKTIEFFSQLESNHIETIVLLGNHDYYWRNNHELNSLTDILKPFKYIRLATEAHFNTFEIDKIQIACCNWLFEYNYDIFHEFIQSTTAQLLLGHFEINGFPIQTQMLCEKAFLNSDHFKHIKRVLSGHFHKRYTYNNITYLGNPYQTTWGENEIKGFHVYELSTDQLNFIANPEKTFHYITYNEQLNITDFDYDIYKDKIVKVYNNYHLDTNVFNNFINKLSKVIYHLDIVATSNEHDNELLTETVNRQNNCNDNNETDQMYELMINYIDNNINTDFDNKNFIKQTIREIYDEATNKLLSG